MATTFKPNGNFNRAFYSPGGMVGKHLRVTAKKVEIDAKALVGVNTGRLKRNIKTGRVTRGVKGPEVEVKADTPYALAHHEGTAPHVITPKRPGGALHWGPRGSGITVVAVVHPGTRPNRYLLNALTAVILFKSF